MTFLKRLSDGFWAYVSPSRSKTAAAAGRATKTPETLPRPVRQRGKELSEVVRASRSMSPNTRVGSWQAEDAYSGLGKRGAEDPEGAGRRSKYAKMDEAMRYEPELEYEEEELQDRYHNEEEEEEEEEDQPELALDSDDEIISMDQLPEEDEPSDISEQDMDDISADLSAVRVNPKRPSSLKSTPKSRSSPSSQKGFYYDDEVDHDTTLVLSPSKYFSPRARKVATLPAELLSREASTEQLAADGWNDDHIVLVQKFAGRGFEPLLPQRWKWDFRWLPDALFTDADGDEEAFLSLLTAGGEHTTLSGVKALNALFEIGGRVRDRLLPDVPGSISPSQQAVKSIKAYMKWCAQDAAQELNPTTTIPILAFEAQPADTPAQTLQDNILVKMERLYARWEEALRARPSIEHEQTVSRDNQLNQEQPPRLSREVPQIYGIIATYTLVALIAYRPDLYATDEDDGQGGVGGGQSEAVLKTVAYFDMKDKDYDVWNTLAFAILGCHLRNVLVDLAEESGVGAYSSGRGDGDRGVEGEDPDV